MLPLSKNEIVRRTFGNEPLPRKERQTAYKLLVWLDKNTNVVIKPVDNPDARKEIRNEILNTIREDYHLDTDVVFSKTRRREIAYLRALAHYAYQTLTGCTQKETTAAFDNARARVTYTHMRNLVQSLAETYPDYQEQMTTFLQRVEARINANPTIQRNRNANPQTTESHA